MYHSFGQCTAAMIQKKTARCFLRCPSAYAAETAATDFSVAKRVCPSREEGVYGKTQFYTDVKATQCQGKNMGGSHLYEFSLMRSLHFTFRCRFPRKGFLPHSCGVFRRWHAPYTSGHFVSKLARCAASHAGLFLFGRSFDFQGAVHR